MQFFKGSLFYKFLLTYLAVLFMPIFMLSLFQYNFYFNVLEKQVLGEKHRSLERSGELVEMQLDQLLKTALRMGNSPDFKPFVFDDDPFGAYRFIRSIYNYTYDDSFSEKIHVYFYGDTNVYTRFNAQSTNEFLAEYALPSGTGTELLRSRDETAFYATEQKLLLLFNLPPGNPRISQGKVAFSIDSRLLRRFFTDLDTAYLIEDLDRGIMFQSHPDFPERDDDFIITYRSSGNRIYSNRIPSALIRSDLDKHRNAYLVVVFLILLVSIPVVYVVTLSQVNPIKRLNDFVHQVTGGADPEGEDRKANELQSIRDTIDGYVRSVDPVVKAQLFFDLLNGKINSTEQIAKRSKEMDLRWETGYHTVMVAEPKNSRRFTADLIHAAENAFTSRIRASGMEILAAVKDNQLVAILGFDAPCNRECLLDLLSPVLRELAPQTWTIGSGSFKQSLELLNIAYAEAQRALEYCSLSGNSELVLYSEIMDRMGPPPVNFLTRMGVTLEKGDPESVERDLVELRTLIDQNTFSLSHIKMIYYELLNMAVRINEKWKYPDTFQIENINNIEEVLELIGKIVRGAIGERKQPQQIPDFIHRIQAFILENSSSKLLSLELLEENFGLSLAYISRSFKKYTSQNISAYIASLRIDRAKELLRNSKLSVHDIISSIGYNDSSSFIRLFKKHEGMTPGEYRAARSYLAEP